jgi:PAS domain S-box-containing protein
MRIPLRELLEAAPDALITVDSDGRIVLVNGQTERLFGYTRDGLIGQRVELLIPERLRDVHLGHRSRYVDEPRLRPMGHGGLELIGRRRNGQEFPVEVSLSPVDADGQLLIMAAIRDVTERRRADQEVRLLQDITLAISEAEDVDTALGQALERVCIASGWDYGQAWLPRADNLLELTRHWYAAGPGLEPFREESLNRSPLPATGMAAQVLASRRPIWFPDIQNDATFMRRDAAIQAGLGSGLAVPVMARGEVVAVLEFFESGPRTEDSRLLTTAAAVAAQLGTFIRRISAEDQLRQMAEDLARSNAELEQFAYVASHDLQEPLRMVASYTRLLARRYQGQLDQDANEFIDFAVDGATRMQHLINDLLAYSRVSTQNRAPQPVNTEQLVDQVIGDLAPLIQEHQAQVARGALPTVLGDARQIGQLFQNLITNAIRYRRDEPPRVHVSARPAVGASWEFSVADNGLGIEPQYYERIFVLFQRLQGRDHSAGTGLGLAICKKIVERHGGRIWVQSMPGTGSTFLFTLPSPVRG